MFSFSYVFYLLTAHPFPLLLGDWRLEITELVLSRILVVLVLPLTCCFVVPSITARCISSGVLTILRVCGWVKSRDQLPRTDLYDRSYY